MRLQWICAAGAGKIWGIDLHGGVVARVGVTEDCPMGKSWCQVGGSAVGMTKVAVGATGHVWGLNRNAQVFVRRGVTARQPLGQAWDPIEGKLTTLTVGVHTMWGTDERQQVSFACAADVLFVCCRTSLHTLWLTLDRTRSSLSRCGVGLSWVQLPRAPPGPGSTARWR